MEINVQQKDVVEKMEELFEEHKNKSVCVVGTTSCGKTTLIEELKYCRDMDTEVFPLLTEEERSYVCQTPWTKEIGRKMKELVREKVKSIVGKPVFGTVVIKSDIIIYLNIENDLLEKRCKKRGVNFADSINMKAEIENEVSQQESVIRVNIGE